MKLGKPAKPKRPAREKVKADPAHVAAARELRDRYLEYVNGEHFNSGVVADGNRVLPNGKYDVSRIIEQSPAKQVKQLAA